MQFMVDWPWTVRFVTLAGMLKVNPEDHVQVPDGIAITTVPV